MLAVLLDPENLTDTLSVSTIGHAVAAAKPDFIFIGGSTFFGSTTPLIRAIREWVSDIPIVLFPGHPNQFSPEADAVLFLSLISGDNPDTLIRWQVQSAREVRDSHIESIPMAYILIGDSNSATARVTHTSGIPIADLERITNTAIAGELLGKHLTYLEAGSGAGNPLSPTLIAQVRKEIQGPLIVGGGIQTINQTLQAWQAGADIIVIGNHLEHNPQELLAFCQARNTMNELLYTK